MKKEVLIVNGYPRSGKDTFAEILGKYTSVRVYSSIDKVKELALQFGWDGIKDDKGRKLLSSLKSALIEYDDLPLKYTEDVYNEFLNSEEEFLILMIRESDEIVKAKHKFNAKTVFVSNNNIKNVLTNNSDAAIDCDGYDYYISNHGTLEEYEKEVEQFYREVI